MGEVTKTQENISYKRSALSQQVTTRLQETGRQAQNTNAKKDPQLKHHLRAANKKSN